MRIDVDRPLRPAAADYLNAESMRDSWPARPARSLDRPIDLDSRMARARRPVRLNDQLGRRLRLARARWPVPRIRSLRLRRGSGPLACPTDWQTNRPAPLGEAAPGIGSRPLAAPTASERPARTFRSLTDVTTGSHVHGPGPLAGPAALPGSGWRMSGIRDVTEARPAAGTAPGGALVLVTRTATHVPSSPWPLFSLRCPMAGRSGPRPWHLG